MKSALLQRFNYAPTETEGRLYVPGAGWFATMEPPWKHNRRFESCVPDGIYTLVPHNGTKYSDTFALVNADLDVVHLPEHREHDHQRSACVLHGANFSHQLEGCIAPGRFRAPMLSRERGHYLPAIWNSGAALQAIIEAIKREGITRISIQPWVGARL